MNHSSVRPASRAALVTPRRLAMLATTAVKTSGGTASLSSWTKSSPTVVRVVASQATSPLRATRPRATPSTRPARIWTQNGIRLREDRTAGMRGTPEVRRDEAGEGAVAG